jgi:subtilisin family serine protease
MKRRMFFVGVLVALLWATPARADNQFIVRSTLSLQALQTACNPPLLPSICTVVGGLGDPLGQVFLITSPLDLVGLLNLVGNPLGILDAEVNQVLNLVGLANLVPSSISSALMSDRTEVAYPANSGTMVWNSYATQPAVSIVEIQQAQSAFNVTGMGIVVADIDTGVDPNHPALQGVLLPGYDFTRNKVGGSEMTDLSPTFAQPTPCDSATCPAPVQVNQSSAAILDQSSAAILDTNTQYAAFGHGTMVMGVIHLVAPTAQLLPLKAFKSDGTADLSNILRAIYYGVQNNASVINMSFDTKTASTELKNALDYANQLGLVSVASAGNDGMQETVYPAALQNAVMGVASVGSTTASDGTRSTFSNFGDAIVWVAAPGEEIVTTYPFSTYAAAWGTSFSAPFVSGAAALARSLKTAITESEAAAAVAQAASLGGPGMGHGRLDLVPALQSLSGGTGSPDFTVAAAPATATVSAGGSAIYTVTASPANGFSQTVTWNCTGAPLGAACSVSPATVTLDGAHLATATVTLMTMARAWSPPLPSPQSWPPILPWLSVVACFAFLVVFFLCSALRHGLRERSDVAATAFLLTLSLCAYACGGGYGGGQQSITLSSIMLNPTSVIGGASSTGTVTLSEAAPSGGAVVYLSSSASAATVPTSVAVAAGATNLCF